MQKHFASLIVLALLAASCNAPREAAVVKEERPDVTVSFYVKPQGERSGLDQKTRVWLNASKPGREAVGSDDPENFPATGGHTFPIGTEATAIAAYYGPVLIRAGWAKSDFAINGNTILFHAPTRITARSDAAELEVNVTPH